MTAVSKTNTVDVGARERVELGDSPLFAQRATLAYTDVAAKDLFTLPAGAIIIGFTINVTTAFNDSGADVIDIGDGTTADQFVADFDVSSIGMTLEPSDDESALSAATTLQGVYTGANTDATAGTAAITVLYIEPSS